MQPLSFYATLAPTPQAFAAGTVLVEFGRLAELGPDDLGTQ